MTALMLRLALLLTGLAARMLPVSQRDWGTAMLGEVVTIADPAEALLFAFGCLRHGLGVWIARHPALVGASCGALATACGIGFMGLTGAPLRLPAINAAALVIGLLALANLQLLMRLSALRADGAALAIGLILAGVSLIGVEAGGSVRWLVLGGAVIQPSLMLVPLLVAALLRSHGPLALAGLGLAVVTLTWQPDRAMSGALLLGIAGLYALRRARVLGYALVLALCGFGSTLIRTDLGEPMPYVDQILWLAWSMHPLAGVLVWAGSLLLVLPALVLWPLRPDLRAALAAQALLWTGAVVAAALGNYPTPLVGYGSSAVIGYCLSLLAFLPPREQARSGRDGRRDPGPVERADHVLRLALR